MKISMVKFMLLGLLIAGVLGSYVIYKVFIEPKQDTIPSINELVTGDVWNTSLWRVEEPPSYAKFENGTFEAMAYQSSVDFFGACLIQQGDNPHSWWNSSAKLRNEITIYEDEEQALILNLKGKRTNQIEWLTDDSEDGSSNIGILLVGDIGLDYYNNDTSEPRALFIDIWLDTNPEVYEPQKWPGVKNVENDYHSGFPVQKMPEIGKEYEFEFRIDSFIREALIHWELNSFKLKMVQCYIEVKAAKASIQVSRILIGTP